MNLADRHAPGGSSRPFQHGARGGPAPAHRLHKMPSATGAIRVLVAVLLFVRRCLLNADLAPVGFQLVSDNQWHASPHPLTHLRSVDGNRDDAIVANCDEYQRIVSCAMRHSIGAVLLGFLGGEDPRFAPDDHQSTRCSQLRYEVPSTEAGRDGLLQYRAHELFPTCPEACLMAAWIRV